MKMENEWHELDIANLPSNILVKDAYEFYWKSNGSTNTFVFDSWVTIRDVLHQVYDVSYEDILFYRKRTPKAPTHEEIMTKWWKSGNTWKRVTSVCSEGGEIWYGLIGERSEVSKLWFVDLDSADIPPEATNE